MRIDLVDDTVLRTLDRDVLQPAVIMATVEDVLEALQPNALAEELDRLQDERGAVERELANLAKAIAAGGPLEALLAELKAAESRRNVITAAISSREASVQGRFNRKTIEEKVRQHLTD